MRLKIVLPERIAVDETGVRRIRTEGPGGSFTLLEHHLDYAAAIVPGILSYVRGGRERFIALDEGILIKAGENVFISTRQAVAGAALGALRDAVESRIRSLDESERRARSAIARLEAGFSRKLAAAAKRR